MASFECDYLVGGAGAVGMAFVDALLGEDGEATVVMIDDHHQPGGHWNDAYPFVRLHQPSHFYGVASMDLGSKRIDAVGFNAGFYELASGAEVQTYFERVMRERLLPSGRVQYFPMSRYMGDNTFENVLSRETSQVAVRRRLVDCTYFKTSVPSRHQRAFAVADSVDCIAPNELPRLAPQYEHYCILGAGKTAMDTGVWLLESGVAPSSIHWVCPRRSWMINRVVTQGSVEFFEESIGGFANQLEALANATSKEDAFDRLEACGFMLRIDQTRRPEMFHYATISIAEVEQLRRIEQLVEAGRVAEIQPSGLVMESGESVTMPEGTLYVDCTASAVDFTSTDEVPFFQDGLITIQPVRMPNPCLSAAVGAYVEANYDDDARRNQLCKVIRLPDDELGFLRCTLGNMVNQVIWSFEPPLRDFVTNCRLDGFGAVIRDADPENPKHKAILKKMNDHSQPALENLQRLVETESG